MVLQFILNPLLTFFYNKPDVIAALAAVVALIFTAVSWNKDRQARELQTIDELRKELMDLERELIEKYSEKSEDERKKWDSLFFNTLEWFAFLINKNKLKDKELIGFFSGAIVNWYDDVFRIHAGQEVLEDPKQYEELKILYKKLRLKTKT